MMTGQEAFSVTGIARSISETIGRTVRYVDAASERERQD
jgi:uncharacterized protein YbjT (DUF2867 family)